MGSSRPVEPPAGPRIAHVTTDAIMQGALAHYAGQTSQPRHRHPYTQVSFLLSGHLEERIERREFVLSGASRGLKPAGTWHDDRWGRTGVLIFSIKLTAGDLLATLDRHDPGWSPVADARAISDLVRIACTSTDGADRESALFDLLSLPSGSRSSVGAPPVWLTRAHDEMLDAPDRWSVAEAARTAGVHRVQFSKQFSRFYGIPPSAARLRALVAQGVAQTVRTRTPLSRAALDAGFSDQAHFTRAIRAQAGLAPGALRASLG